MPRLVYRSAQRRSTSPALTARSPRRTITAPARWDHVRDLAFAFASCQTWDDGYYSAYRRMAEEELEFVVHLGDYLYEYGIAATGGFRNVPVPAQFGPDCETLERYRLQYGLYKSDPDLKRAHQKFPWIIAWDDHEVENDYAGLAPVGRPAEPCLHRPAGGRLPGLLRAHPAPRGGAAAAGACHASTGGFAGATWRSSTWSTSASTAATSRAATASSRAARSPWTRP